MQSEMQVIVSTLGSLLQDPAQKRGETCQKKDFPIQIRAICLEIRRPNHERRKLHC